MPVDILRTLIAGGGTGFAHEVYEALMSPDRPPLEALVEQARNDPDVSDAFRYGLEGLQTYRDFYDERMADMSPQQRSLIEQYDEEWTEELLHRAHQQIYGGPILPSREPEIVPEPEPE